MSELDKTHGRTCPLINKLCIRYQCAFYHEPAGCLIFKALSEFTNGDLSMYKFLLEAADKKLFDDKE